MSSIAIQTEAENAITELSFRFASMVNSCGFQYGCNEDGIFLLNDHSSVEAFSREFTLATTDAGMKGQKRLRFVHVGIDTDSPFTLSVKFDDEVYEDFSVAPPSTGLQRIRVDMPHTQVGRYLTVKITSNYHFVIDDIKVAMYRRNSGIVGY